MQALAVVQWLAVGAANRDYPEDDLGFHMIALSTYWRYCAVSFLPLVPVLPHVSLK